MSEEETPDILKPQVNALKISIKQNLMARILTLNDEQVGYILDYLDGKNIDFKKVWDAYYPVIAACRELRSYYNGNNKHKKPLVMPDPAGKIMTSLKAAELQYNIVLQIEEPEDGEAEIKEPTQETKEEKEGEALRPEGDGS